ncbi:biopolymer transporter ExbD [Nonlabens sp. MIC269]|uniref:ExbD/TolR family protein n=1 Tax=Nonlabens sp. MIC269 TaxID=1476901 RepID=UPI000722C78C|nr:biopolymer transporter ExbD [Nonlabens sp. MIC269]ALM22153.1 biopolymer transporter ExbD [Nonlabens sp. MIC269]
MAKRNAPEVNAGSMADIAFLLLIFFLVTTTIETDTGILRKLSKPNDTPAVSIPERNIYQVIVTSDNQIMVEGSPMEIEDITTSAIAFLDNGGGSGNRTCNYCQGERNPESSDNPDKAVISLVSDRQTDYKTYLTVTDQLIKAYNHLRDREALRLFNTSYKALKLERQNWPQNDLNSPEFLELKRKIELVEDLFPGKLSEAEPVKIE